MLEKVSLEQTTMWKTYPLWASYRQRERGGLWSICQQKCVHKTKPAARIGTLVCFHRETRHQRAIERSLLLTSESGPSRRGLRHSGMAKLSHGYIFWAVNSALNSHTCTTFSSEDIKANACICHTIHSISQPLSGAIKYSTARPAET